jgi:hypothetical protein
MADALVWPVMEAMLAAVEHQTRCLEKPPAVVSMRPGDQIELLVAGNRDECCEGLAWVRDVTHFPSIDFPNPDSAPTNCGPTMWAVVLEIGVARCAPVPDGNSLPSAEDWSAVTEAVHADAAALRRAIKVFKQLEEWEDNLWLVGPWLPLPTEGGCVGGAYQVTIAVVPCDEGVCT